jgi:hypothetical protein
LKDFIIANGQVEELDEDVDGIDDDFEEDIEEGIDNTPKKVPSAKKGDRTTC